MSREALKYMLQMSTVELKVLLNVACKAVDNGSFLIGDHLNLLCNDCFQCSYCARVSLIDEEPPEEEILRLQVR